MKFKITFVDLFIVALVVIFCVALFFKMPQRFTLGERDEGIPTFVNITLTTDVSDEYTEGISVGDVVVEAESGKLIGHISNVEYSDLFVHHTLSDTELAYPEHKTAEITVLARAIRTGDFISISDTRLVIGERYDLITPGLAFDGVCISVSESERVPVFNAEYAG